MKINDILNLDIIDVNFMGRGVARHGDLVVFVIGAITGDKVKAKIIESKKKYCLAEVVEVLRKSEYRCKPKCKYFDRCGGCTLMNLNYEKQLEFKNNLVKNSFKKARVDIENAKFSHIISMDEPYRYRNKTAFAVRTNADGRVRIGTYEIGSHKLVDIDECLIQENCINRILVEIKKIFSKYKVKSFDKKSRNGLIKHIVFRKNNLDEVMVIIVSSSENFQYKNEIVNAIKSLDEKIVTIVQNINDGSRKDILGKHNITLYGEGTFIDRIAGKDFIISPHTFLQVNPQQTEKLYARAVEMADIKSTDQVLDLYCGIGTISLLEADYAARVIGIEVVNQSIKDAKSNAKLNKIDNVRFVCGKVEDQLPKLIEKGIKADIAVVDPPRVGCDEKALEALINIETKKIVYVSCNPSTLARDAYVLTNAGYMIKEIQPVDMFCHSSSVETIVLFERIF